MECSDVLISTTTGFEGGFTKVTAESHTLMINSDVSMTSTTGFEPNPTKITVESLTLMDSSDVVRTSSILCKGSFTKDRI